jgi:hypothetical protein
VPGTLHRRYAWRCLRLPITLAMVRIVAVIQKTDQAPIKIPTSGMRVSSMIGCY